ncbi:hypothetical protein TNCT_199041 [Trichonephila clavata]|uniref:Uncharacterized protein n=1 Tax=Trichonephila clavata TaxID=2740835 RepID=A0A8X6IH80_TRICU|nr:hypothetical protein TNCT_199041 [Trichonephila clavata]
MENSRNISLENINLNLACEEVRIARVKLKARIEVLELCAANLQELMCFSREQLVTAMEGLTSPAHLRSEMQKHLKDAECLIGLIRKHWRHLTGRINHPELLPPARDDFIRLRSKYIHLENDIIFYLAYIEYRYNND